MTDRKILVLGRMGQLGWELRHRLGCLGQVIPMGSEELDLARPESIREAVRRVSPAVVVNAAAYTAVDKAESEPERARAINAIAPEVLAEESERLGCLLVHYSTDYVYDGSKDGAYIETDAPNPINIYGKTKLAGDEAVGAVGGDHLILRTSWVYAARGSNFLLTMLRLAKEKPELRIVEDQYGSPTSAESIAQATADVLAQVLAPDGGGLHGRGGVYHLAAAGTTTWFGFARAILERNERATGEPMPKLIPIPTSEFPRPARRPLNSRLDCGRLEREFGVRIPEWEVGLDLVLETLAEGSARPTALG